MTIRVILADDHDVIRRSLRGLVESVGDVEVVAEAGNGLDAIRSAAALRPDIAFLDISMPDISGIEAARRILKESPGVKVIGLSMHHDKRYVAEMLDAGAAGYLLKDCGAAEFRRAVHAVLAGRAYICRTLVAAVVGDYLRHTPSGDGRGGPGLSPEEREVLQLLAQGRTAEEMAETLHVGESAIETRRSRILERLDREGAAELTQHAIRQGLTPQE